MMMLATPRSVPAVGKRTELGRYSVPAGERVLYGQRIDGHVRVTDVPAFGQGRAWLVERELEQDGHAALLALVADYVLCRARHSTCSRLSATKRCR
jgi:hypothetical protein